MEANNNDDNYQATTTQLDRYQRAYEYLSSFPPGYRFNPEDHVLIMSYLRPRINGVKELPTNLMYETNIYSANPQELTASRIPQGETKWYFFTPRDKKYKNGSRPNRKAGDGYWKATGADKVIKYNDVEIGFRKALVFYKGNPPHGDKTQWIMHEFRLAGPPQANKRKRANDTEDTSMRLDDCVLCSIYKNDGSHRTQTRIKEEDIHLSFLDQDEEDDDNHNQLFMPQTKTSSTNTTTNPNDMTDHNHANPTDLVVNDGTMVLVTDSDSIDYDYLMSSPSTSDHHGNNLMVVSQDQPTPIRSVPSLENGYLTSSSSQMILPPLPSRENANVTSPYDYRPIRSIPANHAASSSSCQMMQPPLPSAWENANVTFPSSVNDLYDREVRRDNYSLGFVVNRYNI